MPSFSPRATTATTASLLVLALIPALTASATRATEVPATAVATPRSERIEPVTPVTPAVPRLESPDAQKPSLVAPPVSQERLQVPRDARDPGVSRELQRLTRTAGTTQAGAAKSAAEAAWQLGLIYLHGAGVRQDAAEAQKWFERAARSGREPWALAGLAWCHIDGCLGPPNPAAAEREIAQLRTRHPARADFLAWLAAARQAPVQLPRPGAMQDTQAPPLAARALLERAASAGDVHANLELGLDAFAQERMETAAQFFRRVAARSAAAAANLREVEARMAQASGKAEARTSAAPEADAALAQARKYHRGEGVPANFAEAIRFYRLADQRGSTEARKMLALIASRPSPDGGFNVLWMQQLAHVDAGGPIPMIGVPVTAHQLQREPTPLFDLLPPLWQRRVTPVGR